MRLVSEAEYRGHTLMLFEARVRTEGKPPLRHWLVIAPDGINILGHPKLSEAEARSFVDSLLERNSPPGIAAE